MDLFQLSDIIIQPSITESYSRVVCEAAWNGCLLVLNDRVPVFNNYNAIFLSDKDLIDKIILQIENNPVLTSHRLMRQERSLEAIWPQLKNVIHP